MSKLIFTTDHKDLQKLLNKNLNKSNLKKLLNRKSHKDDGLENQIRRFEKDKFFDLILNFKKQKNPLFN